MKNVYQTHLQCLLNSAPLLKVISYTLTTQESHMKLAQLSLEISSFPFFALSLYITKKKKAFHLELTSSKQAPPACINFARGQKAVCNTKDSSALFICQLGWMRKGIVIWMRRRTKFPFIARIVFNVYSLGGSLEGCFCISSARAHTHKTKTANLYVLLSQECERDR